MLDHTTAHLELLVVAGYLAAQRFEQAEHGDRADGDQADELAELCALIAEHHVRWILGHRRLN